MELKIFTTGKDLSTILSKYLTSHEELGLEFNQICLSPPSEVEVTQLNSELDFFPQNKIWRTEDPKNWCFQTVVLEKTFESPLDSKAIKPVNPKENQPIGSTDAEAKAPVF